MSGRVSRDELPFVGARSLGRALSIEDAITAIERGFAKRPIPTAPPRTVHEANGGELIVMPAWGEQGVGIKVMTVEPRNGDRGLPLLHGVFLLFDAESKEPLLAVDGAALTALRTAAVSAVATKHLAVAAAARLVIFGAGRQGGAHLEAMCAVRPIEHVAVVDPVRERAGALVARARELGKEASAEGPEAVREADLVCCCTTSTEPVLRGELLSAGCHVNAMGAYRPDMRELDAEALRRSKVIVETREAALAEAGDLLIPIERGDWAAERIYAELAAVTRGDRGRESSEEITIFKSVGVAFEDLLVASELLDRDLGDSRG